MAFLKYHKGVNPTNLTVAPSQKEKQTDLICTLEEANSIKLYNNKTQDW